MRGRPTPASVRAEAVRLWQDEKLTPAQIARRLALSTSTVSEWTRAAGPNTADRTAIIAVELEKYLDGTLAALHTLLKTVAQPEWLQAQTAADLVKLAALLHQNAVELLAARLPGPAEPAE